MSDFKTQQPEEKPLHPFKRVNYTYGLVLGVDEFDQEQVYSMERDNQHDRALHGYGTVCGLKVAVEKQQAEHMVSVSPGIAVNPRGQTIRVLLSQCANLTDWLQQKQNQAKLKKLVSSPHATGTVSLFVVLCYRECKTDNVPVPGGPCRSEQDSVAPSRILDHFDLFFQTVKPDQAEEDLVKRFGQLVGRIVITKTGTAKSKADMEKEVRKLADAGSQPGTGALRIRPQNAEAIMRAVFRIWVTEVRPSLHKVENDCMFGIPDEPCVSLGRLEFKVNKMDWKIDGNVKVDEEDRPILLGTRVLQECSVHG
jgi:hypothetical protein